MRRIWTGILVAVGFFVLILDAKTALNGAVEGLNLCFYTIIPALFPFFVLSIILVSILNGQQIPFLAPLCRLCHMPVGSGSILAVGLLGGYPVGAQAVMQAYNQGQISKGSARRLLGFCNNAGPAFVFGIIGSQFESRTAIWLLWFIHMLSALTVGALLPVDFQKDMRLSVSKTLTVSQAMKKALEVTALVCGWVILFRILITFLNRWMLWLLPTQYQVAIYGLLELSNGCCALVSIANSGLRYILCAGILSFGGLCVAMQTTSVTQEIGLGLYFPGKCLQCLISILLAGVFQMYLFEDCLPFSVWFAGMISLLACGIVWMLRRKKKIGSIFAPAAV